MAKKDIGTGLKDDLFKMVKAANGITSVELMERLSVSKPAVIRWLAELESEGLIRCEKQSGIQALLWTVTDKKVKRKLLPTIGTRFVGDKKAKSKPLSAIGTRFVGGKNPWNA